MFLCFREEAIITHINITEKLNSGDYSIDLLENQWKTYREGCDNIIEEYESISYIKMLFSIFKPLKMCAWYSADFCNKLESVNIKEIIK